VFNAKYFYIKFNVKYNVKNLFKFYVHAEDGGKFHTEEYHSLELPAPLPVITKGHIYKN
jgi:hypothetical protein